MRQGEEDDNLESLHRFCRVNKRMINDSSPCSCFYCLSVFKGAEIKEWVRDEATALCPRCGIDSVLPFELSQETLEKMKKYWFENSTKVKKFDLREFQSAVHENAIAKGFWGAKNRNVFEKLALVHSEVTEALEELRNQRPVFYEEEGKPEGVGPELADIVIRVLDLATYLEINMEEMLVKKHLHNKTRPVMHGGKLC